MALPHALVRGLWLNQPRYNDAWMHPFILHNETIRPSGDKVLAPGQVGLLSGWGVFSTLRICDGVLFEFPRHWKRMSTDAQLMKIPMPGDPEGIEQRLLELVERNQARNGTMRLVVVRNTGGMWEGPVERACDVIALTTGLKQWGNDVRLKFVPHARHAANPFSRAKILSWSMNLTHLETAQCEGYDEVCLLNERGEAAECTSANIFVAKGDEVWTPPLESGCLPGVTRDVLIHELHVPGWRVVERVLRPEDFARTDEVFITSTTRELLPVREIGEYRIENRGKAREALQNAFSQYLSDYVAKKKNGSK